VPEICNNHGNSSHNNNLPDIAEQEHEQSSSESPVSFSAAPNDENKDNGSSSPPPPPPPLQGNDKEEQVVRMNSQNSLSQLFLSPNYPVPPPSHSTGLDRNNSMKSIASILTLGEKQPVKKNASFLSPSSQSEQHQQHQQQPQQPQQPQNNNNNNQNSRASVTTMMSELSADFQNRLVPQVAGGRVSHQMNTNSSNQGTAAGSITSPSHRNHGIIGVKKAPVTPNTLHHQQQQQQLASHSPDKNQKNSSSYLLSSPPLGSAAHRNNNNNPLSSPSPQRKSSAGKGGNSVAAVFGEDLAPIVTMGESDNGVMVTTVNLGMKSKRIAKNLSTHH
jgi:hypothetical protein